MNKQPQKKPMGLSEKHEENDAGAGPQAREEKVAVAIMTARSKIGAELAISFTDAELDETLKVLRAENRRRDGEREASRPRAGSKVRILKGRPRYVGKVGTAVIVRRSRCFVAVPEMASPAYVLVSDLELLER